MPAVPNVLSLLKMTATNIGDHMFTKIGLLYTHVPLLNKLLLLALVVFIVASLFAIFKNANRRKDIPLWWLYCTALLGGVFLVFTQQLVTGITIWPQHFVQYSIPIVYIVGTVSLYKFIRPVSRRIWFVCISMLMVMSLVYGVWMSFSYKGNMEHYLSDQRYIPIYKWLNEAYTKDGCVVLMSEDENYLSGKIPAYTHCDVYYSVYNYYGVPQERVEHGYLSWLRIRGVTVATIVSYLNNHRMEVRSTMFTNWLELWHASGDAWLKSIQNEKELTVWEDNAVKHLADLYGIFLKNDFETELKQYKLDYVIWDKKKYPIWNQSDFPFLKKVYEVNDLVIFAFNL